MTRPRTRYGPIVAGERIGRWTVLETGVGRGGGGLLARCRCVCGVEQTVSQRNLARARAGKPGSAGCVTCAKERAARLHNYGPYPPGTTFVATR